MPRPDLFPVTENAGETNRRSFNIFDVEHALPALKGISIIYIDRSDAKMESRTDNPDTDPEIYHEEITRQVEDINIVVPNVMTCSTCSIIFASREEQVAHFKQDWHRMNVKLQLGGEKPIDQERFLKTLSGCDERDPIELLCGTLDQGGTEGGNAKRRSRPTGIPSHVRERSRSSSSASSASSTGSSTDMEFDTNQALIQHRRHTKLVFRNMDGKFLSLYRCVLHGKKTAPVDDDQLVRLLIDLPLRSKWAVLMLGGGHFAGAVFNGKDVTTHKTFHRYTVRAKQGTAQSLRDGKSAGSQPKSAGSNLRRYNEAALMQEINDLMQLWKEMIAKCDIIFYRAAGDNRRMFFGGQNPIFRKDDPRLRVISFPTRKASFSEVLRVHGLLSTVECFDSQMLADVGDPVPKSPRRTYRSKKSSDDQTDKRESRSPNMIRRAKLTRRESSLSEGEGSSRSFRQGDPFRVGDSSSDDSFEMLLPPQTIETKFSRLQSPDAEFQSHCEWRGNVRDELYTACKIGDHMKLLSLIADLTAVTCSDSTKPNISQSEMEKQRTKNVTFCDLHSEESTSNTCPSPSTSTSPSKVARCLSEHFGRYDTTLLHVASIHGHPLIVKVLLENGADPTKKDGTKKVAYNVASSKSTKEQFKRFVSENPNLYDYSAAQIPAPLTLEEETAKAEKRRALLKTKKERQRKKKLEQAEIQKQELDRLQFLSLKDNDKVKLSTARCYQCGVDTQGQIPFQYSTYKFCSVNCVKAHRQKTTQ